jgi:hypothetical protein
MGPAVRATARRCCVKVDPQPRTLVEVEVAGRSHASLSSAPLRRFLIVPLDETAQDRDALRQASKRGEIRKKCYCGEPFDWTELDGFDCEPEATDGYRLKGFKYPLWLYIHCDKCGHDTALWKLGNPGLLAAIKTAAPELVA